MVVINLMPSLFSKAPTTTQDDDELGGPLLPKGIIRPKTTGAGSKAQPQPEEKKKGFESQAAKLLHSVPALESTSGPEPNKQEISGEKNDSNISSVQPAEAKPHVEPTTTSTAPDATRPDPPLGEKRLFRKTAATEVESGEERRAKRARLLEKSGKDAAELQKFIQRLRPTNASSGSATDHA